MSQPSEWAMGNARKLPVAVGLEQCWCDLTKSEIGCPTCRVEDAIARALDDARAEEKAEGAADVERLRMQVAACGVLALSDTPAALASTRDIHPDYDCASVQDCIRAAESQIALRAEVERLTRERDEARDLYTETEERRSRDLTRMDARVAELEAAFLELQRWLAKYVERRDDVMQNRDDDDQNCMYQVGQRSAALMALGKVNAALAPKEDA